MEERCNNTQFEGSYQTLIVQSVFHNVSQTTVSRAVRQVTEALNSILLQYVIWPKHVQDQNKIKTQFHKFGIPGVLGCIDGTHIAILRPVEHEERYFNRKGYHSLNVMIIEREISVASAQGLELEPNHRVNPDLHRGRLLQRALVERLWRDHTNN
ncbi:hypothetical protein PYW08_006558 [Mythimna loreyi]|uniref:Uncharacterized protein n=1 Tax=Mythimna loreyi TaxID=667449 RepID=A0ACC2QMZ0_9NEOP|nr:hypothetical protein PYW08_006558 [Mythimna loreyi]